MHDARSIFERVTAEPGAGAAALLEYGRVLSRLDRAEQALTVFDRALARQPALWSAHNERGAALVALGRREEAQSAFEAAVELQPAAAAALANLANVLALAGDGEHAERLYRKALQSDGRELVARLGLARVLCQRGAVSEGAAELDRAVAVHPRSFELLLARFGVHAGRYEWEHAEHAVDAFLQQRSGHSGALALRAQLAFELARPEAERLLDHSRFVRRCELFESAQQSALLQELVGALEQHPSLTLSPPHHATQGGQHSGALFGADEPALDALEAEVTRAVQRYVAELAHDPQHPFVAARPSAVTLNGWAVALRGEGFQAPHIHPEAWLSGVCYLALPKLDQAAADSHAGALEFGPIDPELGLARPRASRFHNPAPAACLLFPSYFYHGTVPHRTEELRLSVAFDVIALQA